MALEPNTIFQKAYDAGASDIHIVVGSPLQFRVDGTLVRQGEDPITKEIAESFIHAVLGDELIEEFKEKREVDVSHSIQDSIRLRVNCHFERGNMGMVARIIPADIPSLEELDLVEIASQLCSLQDGLILFTGPTGTGKSTSLSAMIQHINTERSAHIITIEDPIEFVFPKGKGLIRQREYGSDFLSFPEALKRVLRQDPDIVMVGEMRDLETIAAALTLAETGHLVFATLHTPNAYQTVDRIVDVFPPHQQNQVRAQLSLSLRSIVAQRLIPCKDGGRAAHREVLMNTPAVANIIRENRAQELKSVLQTGQEHGMCTFEQDAERLFEKDTIDKETYEWAKSGV